jgi:hypothetical protein
VSGKNSWTSGSGKGNYGCFVRGLVDTLLIALPLFKVDRVVG